MRKNPLKKASPDLVKVTHYIRRDHVIALDRVKAKRLRAGARLGEVDKSRLIREAIDLLIKQEGV